jgi:hypothetical protein
MPAVFSFLNALLPIPSPAVVPIRPQVRSALKWDSRKFAMGTRNLSPVNSPRHFGEELSPKKQNGICRNRGIPGCVLILG